jgi:hypothetical protein
MGKLYILLGEPDDVDINSYSDPYNEAYSSETWRYYEYKIEITFIDKQGSGNFVILDYTDYPDVKSRPFRKRTMQDVIEGAN